MNRRGLLTGALGFLAAPAIVRASSLMPVSVLPAKIINPLSLLGTAPLKLEGASTAVDSYLGSEYAWMIFPPPTSLFGAVPDQSDETILRGNGQNRPFLEGRFRLRRWRGMPLHLA